MEQIEGVEALVLGDDEFNFRSLPMNGEWRPQYQFTSILNKKQHYEIDLDVPDTTRRKLIQLRNDQDFHNLLALDCEMCLTNRGEEVTRIAVVEPFIRGRANRKLYLKAKVVLDTFVLPEGRVRDYRERYGGASASDLEGETTNLQDVIEALDELIGDETILVGHALLKDLRCLDIGHARIIDTSMLYPRSNHPKNSLKFLSSQYLGVDIQQGPHDPVEDAMVTLQLTLLRALSPAETYSDDEEEWEEYGDPEYVWGRAN